MALLLTEQDLRPQFKDPRFMDGALDAVQLVFAEYSRGETQQHPWVNLSWHGERGILRNWFSTSPANGGMLRIASALPGSAQARTPGSSSSSIARQDNSKHSCQTKSSTSSGPGPLLA